MEADQEFTPAFSCGTLPASEVVVIGAGFGGLEVAKALGKAGIETTVIDRHNHHLFQPLLYQVATAALSATDVAEPIRKILRRHASVRVVFGEVCGIEPQTRLVRLTCGDSIRYRHLVLASGATHGYFGHDEWAQWAPGLKTIEDARRIRSQLLLTFERAERTPDPAERERLLSIAVIGGGPTGVELAGSIAELSRYTLARDFRSINPGSARIALIEAGPRLLGSFTEETSAYAKARLERLGVQVRTGEAVEAIDASSVLIAGAREPVGLVIWAAGVAASPLARQLGETDRAGRIPVSPELEVVGRPGIYALGDIALFREPAGNPLPGLAQVAKQQGIHLGRGLAARIAHNAPLKPFSYRSRGNTAIVGRHAAVFETERRRVTGWSAWVLWAIIHVYLLVGFENRVLVSFQWLWRYVSYHRGARLIAAPEREVTRRIASPARTNATGTDEGEQHTHDKTETGRT